MKLLSLWCYFNDDFSLKSLGVHYTDENLAWGDIPVSRAEAEIKENGGLMVYNVVTLPLYRRKGYAKAAMTKLEETARKFNVPALYLKSSAMGVDFYLSLGFTIIATPKDFATNKDLYDHVPMRKELTD